MYVGLWTLLTVLSTIETYVSQLVMEHPIAWTLALRRAAEEWYTWAVLALGVIWFARRSPLRAGHGIRWFLIHTGAAAVTAVIYVAIYSWLLNGQHSVIDGSLFTFWSVFKKVIIHYALINMTMYWLVVLAHHGWHYYDRYREHQLEEEELQKQLVQARLDALRMQLNPHFLFNTLHTISALIHENPEAADRIVARLSDLLRISLDQSDIQEVPLRDELKFLDRYLEIEQTRFTDRLTVERNVEPGVEDALVPCLILQPLVENAVRHGIEPREDCGRIVIRAARRNGMLELSVTDNGSGVPEDNPNQRREGIGLSNTRSRLQHLYGDRQRLELANVNGGGFSARILFPFHRAGES